MIKHMMILVLGVFSQAISAETLSVSSSEKRVGLVELYTSEGCSSCPPADSWLSSLTERGFNHNRVVPLAFHVTYWDYIGWRDPYAQQIFENRQRALVHRSGQRTLYTPHLFLNGLVFRDRNEFARRLSEINSQPARVAIALQVNQEAGVINAQIKVVTLVENYRVLTAVFENDLVSDVSRGENAGRVLRHRYVVRKLVDKKGLGGDAEFNLEIPLEAAWNADKLGMSVFVEQNQQVLQALQLPLTKSPE